MFNPYFKTLADANPARAMQWRMWRVCISTTLNRHNSSQRLNFDIAQKPFFSAFNSASNKIITVVKDGDLICKLSVFKHRPLRKIDR